jgi:hypothetical protein
MQTFTFRPSRASLQRRRALTALLSLSLLLGGLLCAAPALANAKHHAHEALAPSQLSGLDLNLQIEKVAPATTLPNQGVIVKRYLAGGLWTSQGAGGTGHRVLSGSYQLHHGGDSTLEERSIELSGHGLTTTRYRFETPHSGTWAQTVDNGQQQLSGHFTTAPSQPSSAQMLAPATNAGLHVALIVKSAVAPTLPPGVFPSAGLVLQSYAVDGTLTFRGFGPGTLNSSGTYSYKRLSANTAVEEAIQTSDFFSLPYTLVYSFKTPDSGTWYENFANGLIQFSGTFDTFPR